MDSIEHPAAWNLPQSNVKIGVYLLGDCRVLVASKLLDGLTRRKTGDLLAFLLVNRQRKLHRNVIAKSLWPNCADARRYLRQTIWQLHKALKPAERAGMAPILRANEDDHPTVELPSDALLDADLLQHAEAQALRSELALRHLDGLCRVTELYAGPFLEGRDELWVTLERARLENSYFQLVDALMKACIHTKQWARALELGMTALQHDIARESTHRLVMHAYSGAGNRLAALRQYRICADALYNEFGAAPERSSRVMFEKLQRDDAILLDARAS